MKSPSLVIRNGRIFDGTGGEAFEADLVIEDGVITSLMQSQAPAGKQEIDAKGLAVSPGFINVQSWGALDLLEDGRGKSDLLQGITLEVFGECWSEGPLTAEMKDYIATEFKLTEKIPWTTLGEFLALLEMKGVSPNVASLLGTKNLRYHAVGLSSRACTDAERAHMCEITAAAMKEGAMGLGTALIYDPDCFFTTDDLVAINKVVAAHGGLYAAHIRSESEGIVKALDEHFTITKKSRVRSMVYHFKVQGKDNWPLQDECIQAMEQARKANLDVSACFYPYAAGSTGLSSIMNPVWLADGVPQWLSHLQNPETRKRIISEMAAPGEGWENLYYSSGGAEGVLLVEFKKEALMPLSGRSLAEIAAQRNQPPEEAALDLIVENGGDIQSIYFHLSEDNLKKVARQPWACVGSDSGTHAAENAKPGTVPHPRAYGSVARFLGKYARDENLVALPEAVRRLTALPARILGIGSRYGYLKPGYHADIVVFDPETILDHATYGNPHQYATGVTHVVVNGEVVVAHGEHTGKTPGRFVKGPGYAK